MVARNLPLEWQNFFESRGDSACHILEREVMGAGHCRAGYGRLQPELFVRAGEGHIQSKPEVSVFRPKLRIFSRENTYAIRVRRFHRFRRTSDCILSTTMAQTHRSLLAHFRATRLVLD